MPGLLIQIMILGQLGRQQDAVPFVTILNEQMPGFAASARAECRFWNLSDDMIAHVVDGWRKAGLDIPD